MSLSETLDEIKDNVEDVALESKPAIVNPEQKFKVKAGDYDKKVVEQYNTKQQQSNLRTMVAGMPMVDRSLALEIFTMLPEVNNLEQSKLTASPSANNKGVVSNALKGVTDAIPSEVLETLDNFVEEVKASSDYITVVTETMSAVSTQLADMNLSLTKSKPIVIVDGVGANLYTDTMSNFCYMDDLQLGYPKYEGVLSRMFTELLQDPTLGVFTEYYKTDSIEGNSTSSDFSLMDLVSKVISASDTVARGAEELTNYCKSVEVHKDTGNKTFSESSTVMVNELAGKIDTLKHFQMLHGILDTPGNFIQKLEDLVNFID